MMNSAQPSEGFIWTQEPWGAALRCAPLARVAAHLFTSRDLDLRGDASAAPAARSLDLPDEALVLVRQVHGAGVHPVRRNDRRDDPAPSRGPGDRRARPEADIIVSDDSSHAIAVQVADCVPLLLGDPVTGAVAAAHGGWRGLAAFVPRVAVETLEREFGVDAQNLIAAIGPSIGPCCYVVGEDVRATFLEGGHARDRIGAWFSPRGDRLVLDVWAATRDQLAAAGVRAANVHSSGLCTSTHRDRFFSYRAEGAGTGRMLGVIRARP